MSDTSLQKRTQHNTHDAIAAVCADVFQAGRSIGSIESKSEAIEDGSEYESGDTYDRDEVEDGQDA
jgi:hypothetical protein